MIWRRTCRHQFLNINSRSSSWQTPRSRSYSILSPVQQSLYLLNDTLGGKWWSTLVVATISFRILILPLTWYGRVTMSKLFGGNALVLTMRLEESYRKQIAKVTLKLKQKKPNGRDSLAAFFTSLRLFRRRIQGQFVIWRLLQINPLHAVAPTVVQTGCFILYAVSVRQMVRSEELDLTGQGIFWFQNLQDLDPLYILPIAAVCSSYLLIETGLRRPSLTHIPDGSALPQITVNTDNFPLSKPSGVKPVIDAKKLVPIKPNKMAPNKPTKRSMHGTSVTPNMERSPSQLIGNAIQYILILGFPIISSLPSAVFMYWLPSTAFGFFQLHLFQKISRRTIPR